MIKRLLFINLFYLGLLTCYSQSDPRYLTDSLFFADPSVHIFDDRIYIYPSHDIRTDVKDGSDGNHYNMKDYHVLSMDSVSGKVKDHGVALSLSSVTWAGRQLWAPDCVRKGNRFYLYFPAKDRNDIFRLGVAVSKSPKGPFKAQPHPINGTYSIDPAVFENNGNFYLYFGGLKGGQLQRYRNNKAIECGREPNKDEAALSPKIARLSDNMLKLAEEPKDVLIIDRDGKPLLAGDNHRRFFEGAWVHRYRNKYYLSYSTGDTHKIVYAKGDDPYGPFTFQGEILSPVTGWTTHHSIVEIKGTWYLFYHDSKPSGGINYLRSLKVRQLTYGEDGSISPLNGQD